MNSILNAGVFCLSLVQAGGGGDFGGGGSSSGGGGGDSDGDLSWLFALIELTIRHPAIGVPIWILLGYIMYLSAADQGNRRITRIIRRGQKQQHSDLLANAINRITTADPQFQETAFLERVSHAFLKIQEAWSEQDLRRCRAFISDGVHERLELYIRMQLAEGIRNRVENVSVSQIEIVSAASESRFDTIHVRVTATAEISDEPLKADLRRKKNSVLPRKEFTEVWSFSRRHGVKTNTEVSLLAGQCPQCGGSVEIVDRAQCPHCQAIVNSGLHDWVLAEITQDCEWLVPVSVHEIPGWAALTSADPGLSLQHLEDRASVIFWRCLMALYFQNRQLAKPVLFKSMEDVPAPWLFAEGGFWKRPSMGSVQILRCQPSATEAGFDRVVILLRWSGTPASNDRRKPELHGEQTVYAQQLTLKRRSGVSTNVDRAFSSFSCRACGAPIDVGSAEQCRFCHNSLNDGSYDWVAETVDRHNPFDEFERTSHQPGEPEVGPESDESRDVPGLQAPQLLTAVAGLLLADGEIRKREKEFLSVLAGRQKVSPALLNECLAAARSTVGDIVLPANSQQVRFFLNELLRAAYADGKVTPAENEMLFRMSKPLGWSRSDLKQAIGRTRRELFQNARRTLKQSRKRVAASAGVGGSTE